MPFLVDFFASTLVAVHDGFATRASNQGISHPLHDIIRHNIHPWVDIVSNLPCQNANILTSTYSRALLFLLGSSQNIFSGAEHAGKSPILP